MTSIITSTELMSTEDVARELGIPIGSLRYYRSTGCGPASFRLAGRVRYRRSDLFSWIAKEEAATRKGGGAS